MSACDIINATVCAISLVVIAINVVFLIKLYRQN
jgi:hypothetical protein